MTERLFLVQRRSNMTVKLTRNEHDYCHGNIWLTSAKTWEKIAEGLVWLVTAVRSIHFSELGLIAFPKIEPRFFGAWKKHFFLSVRKQQALNPLYHKPSPPTSRCEAYKNSQKVSLIVISLFIVNGLNPGVSVDLSSSYCVIVLVRVVLKRIVVGDWRFDNLSRSHLPVNYFLFSLLWLAITYTSMIVILI